jgi:CBS-domain-containing membrane protein
MSHAKMLALLEKLEQQTAAGRLEWEETEKADVFQVAFPDYSVRIAHATGPNHDLIILSIYNAQGRLIESMTDDDISSEVSNPWQRMQSLHEGARRRAMGVDEAIDKLMAELDKPPF